MVPKYFHPRCPTSSSLESISCPPLRSTASLLFTPRSASLNKTSPLSLVLAGGLVAIGILALLCTVGVGFTLYFHYCRRSDCSICSAIVRFTRSMINRSIPDFTAHNHSPPSQQMQREAYTETPRDRSSAQGNRMSSRTSLPSLTPSPILHIHALQNPEEATPNSVISIRGSATPSIISDNCAPTLGACETLPSHSPPKNASTPSEGKVIHSGRTLDRGSNLSEAISMITLPSFVEHERRSSIPTPVPTPQNPPVVEGRRSLPASRRSSPFQPSRSRDRNTMVPATPSSEKHLMDEFLSPSLSVPERQSHLLHRTHSLPSRRVGVTREVAIVKLESVAQAKCVKMAQPWAPGPSLQPETSHLGPDALSHPKIPTHTHAFLDDYDSTPMDVRSHSHKKPDADAVSYDPPRLVPLQPSPHEALQSPEGAPQPLFMTYATGRSPSYQSQILGFFHSPSSYSSSDERRSRVTSQARSSISTAPSPSTFPSPPDFLPGPRDKASLIIGSHSTSGRTFPSAKLWEGNSVRGIETVSSNEGQTLIPLLDADASRPIPTVNSHSILSKHPHPGFMGRDEMSIRSRVSSRISSMRRLSRMPLGPRQMSDRPKSSRRVPQPPSL